MIVTLQMLRTAENRVRMQIEALQQASRDFDLTREQAGLSPARLSFYVVGEGQTMAASFETFVAQLKARTNPQAPVTPGTSRATVDDVLNAGRKRRGEVPMDSEVLSKGSQAEAVINAGKRRRGEI